MSTRVTTRRVIFKNSFVLEGVDGTLPPGGYIVETGEDLLQGLSFHVWRREWTAIRLPRRADGPSGEQVATIDPASLDAAIARDAETSQLETA